MEDKEKMDKELQEKLREIERRQRKSHIEGAFALLGIAVIIIGLIFVLHVFNQKLTNQESETPDKQTVAETVESVSASDTEDTEAADAEAVTAANGEYSIEVVNGENEAVASLNGAQITTDEDGTIRISFDGEGSLYSGYTVVCEKNAD